MAKFSQAFLQGLLQPTYQQGLFTAAQQAAQLPGQLQQQQMQQQQMQALRSMTPMQRAQYAMQTAKTPAQITAAQAQINELTQQQQETEREKNKVTAFKAMGEEYSNLYTLGVSEGDIIKRYTEDAKNATKKEYGKVLNLPDDVIESLTMEQIVDRVEAQKSEQGQDEYAEFIANARGAITAENYNEAIQKAVKANGVQGIQQVNTMYGATLERQAKAKQERIVDASVSLRSGMGVATLGGVGNLSKVKVSVDGQGNLTPESKAYLENIATSAFVPSINKNFNFEESKGGGNNGGVSGEDPEDPTIGSLFD